MYRFFYRQQLLVNTCIDGLGSGGMVGVSIPAEWLVGQWHNNLIMIIITGGFHKWGYPKLDGL